jgi:hypothetical protein
MCPESNLCLRLSSGVLLHPGVIHQTFLPAALLMAGINILCLHGHKTTITPLLMCTLWKSSHIMGFLHMDVMHIQLALLLPQGINTYLMGLLKLVALNLSIMKT